VSAWMEYIVSYLHGNIGTEISNVKSPQTYPRWKKLYIQRVSISGRRVLHMPMVVIKERIIYTWDRLVKTIRQCTAGLCS
jgi:hypothetical protein